MGITLSTSKDKQRVLKSVISSITVEENLTSEITHISNSNSLNDESDNITLTKLSKKFGNYKQYNESAFFSKSIAEDTFIMSDAGKELINGSNFVRYEWNTRKGYVVAYSKDGIIIKTFPDIKHSNIEISNSLSFTVYKKNRNIDDAYESDDSKRGSLFVQNRSSCSDDSKHEHTQLNKSTDTTSNKLKRECSPYKRNLNKEFTFNSTDPHDELPIGPTELNIETLISECATGRIDIFVTDHLDTPLVSTNKPVDELLYEPKSEAEYEFARNSNFLTPMNIKKKRVVRRFTWTK
jgi:hypothetical protein